MNTVNLSTPLMAAGQSQKHVTHNEALLVLDDLVQLVVEASGVINPPASASEGARFLLGSAPVGLWAGRGGQIASWRNNSWTYHQPATGWTAFARDISQPLIFDGVNWLVHRQLGINTTADATNRLAVSSTASLFNHDGAGHQAKINKAASGETASLLFQTAFSGRAEIGTMGNDMLGFKVSTNGTNWKTALSIDPDTALLTLPAAPEILSRNNLLINAGFAINQRGFTGGAMAAGSFGPDRWKAGSNGATMTVTTEAITLTAGTIIQIIEPSLWGMSGFGGDTLTFSVENLNAPLNVSLGGVSGVINAGSGRKAVSLVIPLGQTGPLTLEIGSSAASITVLRPKLERGAGATSWRAVSLVDEEQLCQRYFRRFVGPIWVYLTASISGAYFFTYIPLGSRMRTNPSVTRQITQSDNLQNGNISNAAVACLDRNLLQFSIRCQSVGASYAVFENVVCDAEL
jgi:Protein of unknown function (DUF2793)